jgi:hypothetical protein
MCQNWVLIWRWIMEQKKPWSPGVKPMSFLGVLERLWLCLGSLFFFLLFLSYRKLFFYTNVRGSWWSSHS